MVNKPSNQPGPHATSDAGKANDVQSIRKGSKIREIFGFSKSKTKKAGAITTHQAVNTQGLPRAAGPPTSSPAGDIHSIDNQALAPSPPVDKPLPAPVEARRTSNIFLENLPAPAMKTELPAIHDRIEVTQQLVYCSGLLLRGSSSPLATATELDSQACDPIMALQSTPKLDKKELDWLAEMDVNLPAQERIRWLRTRMVDEFAKDVLKDSTEIAEIVLLGPVLEKETYRSLLSCTIAAFEQSALLNVDLLQGLVQLVQVAPPESLVSDDLVKIFRVFRIRLQDTHQQSSVYPFHLTLALSRLLDVMAEHKVKDLNRVEDHEPLLGILSGLKGSSDPYLMYQACYAFQALQYVPDDESALQSVLRHGTGVVNGLIQVSGVFKLDLGAVLEGLGNLQGALSDIIVAASDVYKGVNSVIESGRGVLNGLKGGSSEGKKRPWYAAIRVAQTLFQAGQLKDLNQLVYEAPCRGDPLFQWGICQLLGEIASDNIWDTNVRQQAVNLLRDLYKNDPQWGQDESVKTWVVNIIGQLSTVSDEVVNTIAMALLKDLHQDQGTPTQLPYPLRNRLPLPTSSPILARVQNITPLEYDLCQYQFQRIQQHRQAVYISPLAKPNLKAKDEDAFPLLEKVLEFLASERQVMLVLGDSGSGKSTFNRHLEHRLWTDYKRGGLIPLFINLPAIDRPDQDLIAKHLRANNFSDDQIQEMKQHRKLILICDGYDESQQQGNLHRSNALNQPGQWNTKMIISCRTQFLGSTYVDRFKPQPTDLYASGSQDLLQEAVITPFSKDQVKNYVEQYAQDSQTAFLFRNQPAWSSEEYMYKLAAIPNIMDLVKNPFLLALALKALPGLVASNKDLSSIRITRVHLYDMFVDQWLEINRLRIQPNKLSQKDLEAYTSLMDDDFIRCGISYLVRLAAAIFKEQNGNPVVQYVHRQDKDSWKVDFFGTDPEAKLLREASPLMRTGNRFRFVHRSVLEYLLSRVIYNPVETVEEDMDPESETEPPTAFSSDDNSPLFQRNLLAEPSIIQFLCDRVKSTADFEQQLRAVIDLSKTDPSAAIAATNAITILVRAGLTFHGADLRGVKIPGADLSGGQFDYAQFQGADLTDVNLSRSWLRKVDLSGAQMDGVQFGELPYLEVEVDMDVRACAYSLDGRMLAVGVTDWEISGVSIYDTSSWTRTYSFTTPYSVETMAFSPDGTRVVFGKEDGLVTLWDCASGQEMFVMEGCSDYRVKSVTFSPCGKHIASSDDESVRVWDSQTGESLFVLEGHTETVVCVKYFPSGGRLISGSEDHTIRFWDLETREPGIVLDFSFGTIYIFAFSLDGRWMASGHAFGALQLWHVVSGEPGPVLHGHTDSVTGIAFSPDSRWIASSSDDGTVRLWDVSTGTPINTLSIRKNTMYYPAFSPDGLQIASGGADSRVWLRDVHSILISSVEQQEQLEIIHKTVYSPNGRTILTVGGMNPIDQTVQQWDSMTGAPVPLLIELPKPLSVLSVSYTLDDIPTVAVNQDGTLRLWELQAGRRETILQGYSGDRRVIMSPCCRWIMFGAYFKTVTLWDLASTQRTHVLVENGVSTHKRIGCLVFSATGHQFAVGFWSGTIQVFDSQSKGLVTSKKLTDKRITAMSFSPDDHQLSVGVYDCSIYVWGLQSEKHAIELRGHTGKVKCIAYSPCGEWIASGSEDKTVRVWRKRRLPGDTESWSCVSTVHGFFSVVLDIAWSPTVPMEFVTGCYDKSVRVWRVSSDGEDVVVKMLWGTNLAELCAAGLTFKGTTGLGFTEQKLLVQCGAMDNSLTLEEVGGLSVEE